MDKKTLDSMPWASYRNVDAAADPTIYVDHMDTVASTDVVQAYKAQSFDLMAIEPGYRLLEIGCGPGDDALALARRVGGGGHVLAIDKSETMIAAARARARGLDLPVTFRQGDVFALDLEDEAFDACRADRVFHHLDSLDDALAEVVRVTRPGGRIVLSEPDFGSIVLSSAFKDITRLVLDARCDEYTSGWCGRELRGLFRRAGLTDILVKPVPVVATDFEIPNEQWFGLANVAKQLQHDGVLTAAQVDQWVEQMAMASTKDEFFCSILVFTVCGRKPV